MIWLLTEILVFVAAAAVFGAVIGLGLAGTGGKRRAVAFEREHQDLAAKVETYARTQHLIEGKAVARAAAEAAARGDLEGRLVEMEAAAADYRARAEAAERRLSLMQPPAVSPALVEVAAPVPPESAEGAAEPEAGPAEIDLRAIEIERDAARDAAAAVDREIAAARALQAQEIASLKAQLSAAERVRARAESDLAVAHARGDATRTAWGGPAIPIAAPAPRADPNGDPSAGPGLDPGLVADGERPEGLAAPRGGRADDLRRIRGIGPKNEGVLNALGLFHYEQIAALTPENVAWLDAYLKFHGRIARDDWVGQAKMLLGRDDPPSDKVHPHDAGA
jgi:predicted flap endonuclease-1-like 5' DNA nuclease